MLLNIEIEKANEKDLPAILDLYAQPEIDNGNTLSIENAKVVFSRIASYPNYKIYIAKVEGMVVGTFALLIMDNLGHLGAPSGIVEDVAVNPQMQGQGIGKAMMEFARLKCRELGCYKLTLSSSIQRKNAHEFYKSLGFSQHGYSFLVNPDA